MKIRRLDRSRIMGAFMFLVAVFLLFWLWWNQSQEQEHASCLNRANSQLTFVLKLRGEYSDQQTYATQNLIVSVFSAKNASQFREAYAVYKAAEKHISNERKEHPIPNLRTACN